MKQKDFFKIINEEISEFDYLNNDEYLAEQEDINRLKEEFFQKQFIMDSITKMNDKIKLTDIDIGIGYIDPELGETQHNDLYIEYSANVEYKFNENEEPIKFNISFGNYDTVSYTTGGYSDPGDYHTKPEGESYIDSLNWYEIPVSLYSLEGDEIEFKAFNKEPENVRELFVRSYLEDAIENKTGFDIQQKRPTYNSPPAY